LIISFSVTPNDLSVHTLFMRKPTQFQQGQKYIRHRFNAMGGPCEIKYLVSESVNTEKLSFLLESEVRRLENKYSRFLQNSVTSKINRATKEPLKVDSETAGLLSYAQTAFQQSDGLFDITAGSLRKVWDFKTENIPSQSQIDECLLNIGWQKVNWDGEYILLKQNMEIDLGGVVKEYAADSIAHLARCNEIYSGFVNLGGDISIIGPEIKDGKEQAWQLGISDPDAPERAIAYIDMFNGGLASSGDYERYFVKDEKRYCHILNPKTGWPCQSVAGVSIQGVNCLTAGTMTTIAMLKGYEEGKQWLEDNNLEFLIFRRK